MEGSTAEGDRPVDELGISPRVEGSLASVPRVRQKPVLFRPPFLRVIDSPLRIDVIVECDHEGLI